MCSHSDRIACILGGTGARARNAEDVPAVSCRCQQGRRTLSTRKALMPLPPGWSPVRAMTRYTSAAPPPLMNALLPATGQRWLAATRHQ